MSLRTVRRWLTLASLALLLAAPSASQAYIDMPAEGLTIPRLLLEFRSVGLYEVERVDLDRGAVKYKLLRRLQGKLEATEVKHAIKYGEGVPAELKSLKPRQRAVLFSADGYGRGVTLAENAWYCSNVDPKTSWWHIAYTASHYDFNCAYVGTATELVPAIERLLRGDDVVVRCRKKSQKPETEWVRCSLREPHKKPAAPAPATGAASNEQPEPKDRPPVAKLLELLQSAEPRARTSAALALADHGSEAKPAVTALTAALARDKDPFVRRAAVIALGAVGPEAKAAVPTLIAALQSQYENIDGLISAEAALALASIDPQGAASIAVLVPRLSDANASTRLYTAISLSILGPLVKDAAPALCALLKDKEDGVRHAAAGALGNIRPDPAVAVPAMMEALNDSNQSVRVVVLRSLGAMGPAARAALVAIAERAKDKDEEVRQTARETLKRVQEN